MRKCENCDNGTYKKRFCSKKCCGEYKSKNTCLVDKETLYKMYHTDNLTAIEIADKLKCSVRSVFKYVEKYNFEPKLSYTDYKDKQVGDLLFLEPILPEARSGGGKHVVWIALCKRCNQKCEMLSHTINTLKNKCCWKCGRFAKRKGKYVSGTMFQTIKSGAKVRSIEFNITLEYIENLFDQQNKKCALTGMLLEFAENAKQHQKGFTTASLDRKDSNKGYIEGNVWWVHKRINHMKSSDTTLEFIEWCKKVASHSESLDSELRELYTTTSPLLETNHV